MSFNCCRHTYWLQLMFGVSFSWSCASEQLEVHEEVGSQANALELACSAAPADAVGEITAILPSTDPLDASKPQTYGSEECTGFVFEFDNVDEEELRGAWIQASADTLDSHECSGRVLEADYWGFQKREWTRLGSVSSTPTFAPGGLSGAGACRLDGLIEHAGVFEKLRIIARVARGPVTYPMYACVW